jgi:serine/threonine-protein kinase
MLEVVDEPLAIGRVIAGKYRLEALLGQGGMGVVWAAREVASERPLALKFLREGSETEQKNRARFLREARAAMAVTHPNVAKVHAVLETDAGMPFIVMDLLEGDSLRELLRKRGALTIADCARLFVPIVDAVEAAHALGIVHRDLKPENVFLQEREHVRVLDFGIAKQMPKADETASQSLTSTGALLGTPQYMAPEQIFGDDDLDGRADVWALGVMLYECLAGRRPIEGAGLGPIIRRITVDPIPSLTAQPGVPTEVAKVVDRMLSRDRSARPSLKEVRETILKAADAPDLATRNEKSPRVEKVDTRGGTVPTAAPLRPRLASVPTPPPPVMMMPPTTTAGVASKRPSIETQPPAKTASSSKAPVFALALGGIAVAGVGAFFARPLVVKMLHRTDAASVVVQAEAGLPSAGPSASVDPQATGDLATAPPAKTIAEAGAKGGTVVPTSGGEAQTASEWGSTASAALAKRDGGACVHALDMHDRLATSNTLSTSPGTTYNEMRVKCIMLTGDCDAGKSVARAYAGAKGQTGGEAELLADRYAASYCTAHVGPREEVRRAGNGLSAAGPGKTKPADCMRWYDTIRTLTPQLDKRTPGDDIGMPLKRLGQDAPVCAMYAGDCPTALRFFKETRPQLSDADARDQFSTLAANYHYCQGMP